MYSGSATEYVGFRCRPEVKALAEREAERRGLSLSQFMRILLDDINSACSGAQTRLNLPEAPQYADASETYLQTYAGVRAILEGRSPQHALVALQAAQAATEQHIKDRLGNGGGHSE